MTATCIRHRSASGDVSSCWEFDPARQAVDIVFRLGDAEPIALTVPVCSQLAPRMGAWALMQVNAESWRVLPLRFVFASHRVLVPEERAIHEAIGFDAITLTNAPPNVAQELERL